MLLRGADRQEAEDAVTPIAAGLPAPLSFYRGWVELRLGDEGRVGQAPVVPEGGAELWKRLRGGKYAKPELQMSGHIEAVR